MADGRRVVVTGLGALSPLGNDVASTWSGMVEGRSGIGPITAFDASNLRTRIAGELKDFDPETWLPRKEARRLDRFVQIYVAAAIQAMDDAGIEVDEATAPRMGAIVGTGMGGLQAYEEAIITKRERGPDRINPLTITRIIANMAAGYSAIHFGFTGPTNTTITACAASANAIGDATELIRRGAADVMLSGGAETGITEFVVAAFNASRALSTRNDDPETASRPFDLDRDGFVMGEGGAALVLEERERALARGATVYGEVLGYGMSTDAYHVTLPRPGGQGQAVAMELALADAGLAPSDIDYVNAHGTSTPANDATETAAIHRAFGSAAADLAISSTKSVTGHLLGGAGAIEAMACLLAIRDGVVPPTATLTTPDPECDLDYVPGEARELPVTYTMSNSFGFGGHNVALVLGRA
ncbi:MAG: beta-ketoacyl-ACP synthase II [Acidimicrobiia bacterium]